MLTVEEIKKCIEEFNPEGFHINPNGFMFYESIYLGDYKNYIQEGFNSLFLQRVIEGINRTESPYCIIQDQSGLRVWDAEKTRGNNFYLWNHESIDQAKEQAIKYILERI